MEQKLQTTSLSMYDCFDTNNELRSPGILNHGVLDTVVLRLANTELSSTENVKLAEEQITHGFQVLISGSQSCSSQMLTRLGSQGLATASLVLNFVK